MQQKLAAFERLLHIMDTLRAECPWDRKQTMTSLRSLTIEETYELADAILDSDTANIEEELGDLFLHLVFYSKIAEEQQEFDVASVLNKCCEKLIRRHPHIYGDISVEDEEEVKRNWEQIKQAEKKGKKTGVLSGVPRSLPAIVKAHRMQEKTAQVGFEWEHKEDVWKKFQEEMAEFETELKRVSASKSAIENEFGDVFFSLINLARFYDIDPETALEKTNRKFKARFEYIEANADKSLVDMSLEEMDALWDEAKKRLRPDQNK